MGANRVRSSCGRPHEIEQARRHPHGGHRARRGRYRQRRGDVGGVRRGSSAGRAGPRPPCASSTHLARPSRRRCPVVPGQGLDGIRGRTRGHRHRWRRRPLGAAAAACASASSAALPISTDRVMPLRTAVPVSRARPRPARGQPAGVEPAGPATGQRSPVAGWPKAPMSGNQAWGQAGLACRSTHDDDAPAMASCQPTDEVAIVAGLRTLGGPQHEHARTVMVETTPG